MAEPLYAFRRDLANRIKKNNGLKTSGGVGGKVKHLQKSSGGRRKFFKLLEDASGEYGPAWAIYCDRLGEPRANSQFQIYWFDYLLSGSKAGYKSTCEPIDGEVIFEPGKCLSYCFSDGTISVGEPVEGVVGDVYSHTITHSDLTIDSLAADGLPAGLTMDTSGVISGTPTEGGTFYVSITGTSLKTGPEASIPPGTLCTITKILVLTIAPASEE